VLRAWDINKPVIACPAMNTSMWNHPFTARHMDVIKDILGFIIVDPISKKLACGDTGNNLEYI
jgi:phosphopantothenoylcysteine decarboxylase